MIAAEIQQRDEALTAAGHDPECAAFDDRECSCSVGEMPRQPTRKGKIATTESIDVMIKAEMARRDQVVLEGDHARAYRRWQAAMAALRTAKEVFAAAGQEAQAAHEALAMLSVGAP